MKTKFIGLLLSGFFLLSACADYMAPYPYGQIYEDDAWKYPEIVSGLVFYAYERSPLSREYRNWQGNRLDCATDDGVYTNTGDNVYKYATGTLLASSNVWDDYWRQDYQAIASLNHFLKDHAGYNSRFYYKPKYDSLFRDMLQSQAFALRAYFQFDLLKRWGGVGISSGKLLGFPIILERLTTQSTFDFQRNTYEECMQQIQKDADSAIYYGLPMAHRDYLVSDPDARTIIGGRLYGMIDQCALKSILAEMYLTAASPLFQSTTPSLGNKEQYLQKAARYAKDVIDFKLDTKYDGGNERFDWKKRLDWQSPTEASAVWQSRRQGNSDTDQNHEKDCYPGNFQGNGVIGVTQDLVDAYPDSLGYPIDHPKSVYQSNNPYSNRDMRFKMDVFYNGLTIRPSTRNYVFEAWDQTEDNSEIGKDSPGQVSVSRTGYHLRKMTFSHVWGNSCDFNDANPKRRPRSKFQFHWAQVVLTYAEAMAELNGANKPLAGDASPLTAKEALSYIRGRGVYDVLKASTSNVDNVTPILRDKDPYLDEAAGDPLRFKELVRNERRITLCFEGFRYYDIRRWATNVSEINKQLHRIQITRKADETFAYTPVEIEKLNYPSLYTPIPLNEVKRGNIEQNKGWESWQ